MLNNIHKILKLLKDLFKVEIKKYLIYVKAILFVSLTAMTLVEYTYIHWTKQTHHKIVPTHQKTMFARAKHTVTNDATINLDNPRIL